MILKLIIQVQNHASGFSLNGDEFIAYKGSWLYGLTLWGQPIFFELNHDTLASLNVASCWRSKDCVLAIVCSRGVCLVQSDSNPKLDEFTNPIYNIHPDDAYRKIEEAYAICRVHDA